MSRRKIEDAKAGVQVEVQEILLVLGGSVDKKLVTESCVLQNSRSGWQGDGREMAEENEESGE